MVKWFPYLDYKSVWLLIIDRYFLRVFIEAFDSKVSQLNAFKIKFVSFHSSLK